MGKYIFIILVIAIGALFIVPESMIGEYKGILNAKYFIKDASVTARNIISSLARGEMPAEFKVWEEKAKEKFEEGKESAKEQVKDTLKDAAKDAIDEL